MDLGTNVVYALIAGALCGGVIWFVMKKDDDEQKKKTLRFALIGGVAAAVAMWILR